MKQLYTTDVHKLPEGSKVEVLGWVHELRDLGGVKFLVLRDREGFLQVTFKKDLAPELLKKFAELNHEDVVRVIGTVRKDPRAPGGTELLPEHVEVLAKAKEILPLDVTEKVKAEAETRFDYRVLDLRRPRIHAIFRVRDALVEGMRQFLRKQGFIEIYTPKIIGAASEGGAQLFPVLYYGKEAFLSQSPQLYKQLLVIAGFEKVYEIGPYFRAEESHTTRHLSESTAVDVELAWTSLEELVDLHYRLLAAGIEHVLEHCSRWLELLGASIDVPEKVVLDFEEAKEITKRAEQREELDFSTEEEKILGEQFGNSIVYVLRYPLAARPFYTQPDPRNPEKGLAFDGIYKGLEIVSGSVRVHDPELLRRQLKERGIDPARFGFYVEAFEYGAPPHGGFGTGIERILKQLLNLPHVREAIFFPRLPNRLVP
ncbi:MAG: aspartate--tRNA(Asn) ligase [bacterium]|nr:aspartate--tRNA(Asn) ligase [bacterium]